MKLNGRNWKPFLLKDLYVIKMGNKFDKDKMSASAPEINFVSRQSYNNGVDIKVDQVEGVTPYEKGLLTVALGGSYLGSCFVQEERFYTAQNVAVMTPRYQEMSHNVNLFISALVRYESKIKYYAFGRELNTHINKDFTISLPVKEAVNKVKTIDSTNHSLLQEFVPDWQYMEDYIKSLHHKPITTTVQKKNIQLDTRSWKEFKVGDFFDIRPTKAIEGLTADDCTKKGVPLVVNSAENNGIAGFCDREATEGGNIITFSDTTDGNTFFYQPGPFIGFAHVQGMYPKTREWSSYELLFFLTVLMFDSKDRFSYGRKMRRDIILETKIKLPQTSNGTPDWQYMENYIKNLPYGDRI